MPMLDPREYKRQWRKANLEKQREYSRQWRLRNPDKSREQCQKYAKANREKIAERSRIYHAENVERESARHKRWRQANPEKYNARRRRRYQLLLARKPAPGVCFAERLHGVALYAAIAKLVPRYSPDVRDDIISAVYLGVLEGAYPLEVTKDHVKLEVTKHFRGSHETRSLDQNVFDGKSLGTVLGIY